MLRSPRMRGDLLYLHRSRRPHPPQLYEYTLRDRSLKATAAPAAAETTAAVYTSCSRRRKPSWNSCHSRTYRFAYTRIVLAVLLLSIEAPAACMIRWTLLYVFLVQKKCSRPLEASKVLFFVIFFCVSTGVVLFMNARTSVPLVEFGGRAR